MEIKMYYLLEEEIYEDFQHIMKGVEFLEETIL